MNRNPDVYLLYEYSDKVSYTVRMRFILDAEMDALMLTEAAQEAIGRFPYLSVQVGLDEGQNYTLAHNDRPVAVLPEQNRRIVLGSEEVNGHLVAITYRKKSVWFSFSHTMCGAKGALFWIKTTLYLYMTKHPEAEYAGQGRACFAEPVGTQLRAFPEAERDSQRDRRAAGS